MITSASIMKWVQKSHTAFTSVIHEEINFRAFGDDTLGKMIFWYEVFVGFKRGQCNVLKWRKATLPLRSSDSRNLPTFYNLSKNDVT